MAAPAPPPFTDPPLGTVLVTGGCGFLGSHIVQLILEKNQSSINTQIHVLDVREPAEPFQNVKYHTADLTSSSSIRSLLVSIKPDVVIHTASPVFTSSQGSNSQKTRDLMYKVNVEGTRNLVEESKRLGVKAFIYTSSASVISDNTTDLINADERYTLIRGEQQTEFYSDTKAEAETLTLSSSTRTPSSDNPSPFLTTALRPASMFGERDAQFIPPLLKVVHDARTRFQLGENNNLFDVTYVGNVAQAHILAAVKLLELHRRLGVGAAAGGQKTIGEGEKGGEEEEDDTRVDGEAFFITNQSPVYFWDFTRFVWHTYFRLSSTTNPSHKLTTPTTSAQAFALPKELALFISTILTFIMGILGLGKPTLEPQKVRFSCMTRYYRGRKAEGALGYVPMVPLDVGVVRTVRWFVEREAGNGGMEKQAVEGKKER